MSAISRWRNTLNQFSKHNDPIAGNTSTKSQGQWTCVLCTSSIKVQRSNQKSRLERIFDGRVFQEEVRSVQVLQSILSTFCPLNLRINPIFG